MAQYDPNKNYSWKPEDVFELTGQEFNLILNTFRATLNTPEARKILLINEASASFEAVLARAVEKGTVVEMPMPEPSITGSSKVDSGPVEKPQ